MAVAYQGPVPTQLVTLSDLINLPVGTKVRFLGSVTKYDISLATLTLEHNCLAESNFKALVDISLLLNTVKSTDTSVGEWVNVMGYITEPQSKQQHVAESSKVSVSVQAIVLWSAGSIKINEYHKTVAAQHEPV